MRSSAPIWSKPEPGQLGKAPVVVGTRANQARHSSPFDYMRRRTGAPLVAIGACATRRYPNSTLTLLGSFIWEFDGLTTHSLNGKQLPWLASREREGERGAKCSVVLCWFRRPFSLRSETHTAKDPWVQSRRGELVAIAQAKSTRLALSDSGLASIRRLLLLRSSLCQRRRKFLREWRERTASGDIAGRRRPCLRS